MKKIFIIIQLITISSWCFSYTGIQLIKAIDDHDYEKAIKICKKVNDINYRGENDYTPLIAATEDIIFHPPKELFEALVGAGADLELTTENFERKSGFIASMQTQPQYGWTALFYAARAGNYNAVEVLVKAGANVDKTTPFESESPLLVGIKRKKNRVVDILVKAGADIELKTDKGLTPLIWALDYRNTKAVKILVKNGANVNHIINNGFSPLIVAVRIKDIEMVDVLIKAGADINYKSDEGDTALSMAKKLNYTKIADRLVEQGATE